MGSIKGETLQNHSSNHGSIAPIEVSREDIRAAIAKAVELRALRSALLQANSPANAHFSSATASQFSSQDYPIFTPSYKNEPLPGYQQLQLDNQTLSECWEEYELAGGNGDETISSNPRKPNGSSSGKGFPSETTNLESHTCPSEDQISLPGSCSNNLNLLRQNSLGDFRSLSSSCNKCKPAIVTSETDHSSTNKNIKNSHSSVQSKTRGLNLSRLFPRLKKKNKNGNSPNREESEEVSQVLKDSGVMSVERLKRELMKAIERRDAALTEAEEMKFSFGELRQKLEKLETYCEELKTTLKQAAITRDSQFPEKIGNLAKLKDGKGGNLMPVSEEVMVEGFLQIVTEARASVKQFCKILLSKIEEDDSTLMEKLNLLLEPYKLSINSKHTKAVLYHLEAIINRSLYQDFENCVFRKNGPRKLLDPHQDRQARLSSFLSLRNLSWNQVLKKGTKYYSEEFSKFCDEKMSCFASSVRWTRPWPEGLLESFFVAAKCIWLLHLLAFSFNPPLGILRVEENRSFDQQFMEDVLVDRQGSTGPTRVHVMVMPGFYVQGRVLKCRVLCSYKSLA